MRTLELADVFGVIVFCVGNLMACRAQVCYHETPISAFTGLTLVLLTDVLLLYPFLKKLYMLCASDSEMAGLSAQERIVATLALSFTPHEQEDEKRHWTTWLARHGCIPFELDRGESSGGAKDFLPQRESLTCPICLDELRGNC